MDAGPSVVAEAFAFVAKLDLLVWCRQDPVVVEVEADALEGEAEHWWRGSMIVPCMAECLDSSEEVRILDSA